MRAPRHVQCAFRVETRISSLRLTLQRKPLAPHQRMHSAVRQPGLSEPVAKPRSKTLLRSPIIGAMLFSWPSIANSLVNGIGPNPYLVTTHEVSACDKLTTPVPIPRAGKLYPYQPACWVKHGTEVFEDLCLSYQWMVSSH